jgi:hypothetical protein
MHDPPVRLWVRLRPDIVHYDDVGVQERWKTVHEPRFDSWRAVISACSAKITASKHDQWVGALN